MRKFIKKFKNSILGSILKIIWKLLCWIVGALFVFLAIVIVTQRITNNQKTFLGFRIFSVATGSMEPEYAVGDVLIVREKDPSTIVVGDNIVYLGAVADYSGKIITHNVIEIEQNENGEYLFHTKGIANTIEDPIVHEDQLYGVVFYNNEFIAGVCKILNNRYGLYLFVVFVILDFFIGFIRNQGERIEQEKEEERQRREKQKRRAQKKDEAEFIEAVQVEEEVVQEKTKRKTAPKKKLETQEIKEDVKPIIKKATVSTKNTASVRKKRNINC